MLWMVRQAVATLLKDAVRLGDHAPMTVVRSMRSYADAIEQAVEEGYEDADAIDEALRRMEDVEHL